MLDLISLKEAHIVGSCDVGQEVLGIKSERNGEGPPETRPLLRERTRGSWVPQKLTELSPAGGSDTRRAIC